MMAKYSIQIKKSAYKEIKKLPTKDLEMVLAAIDKLAINPRIIGSIKLSNDEKYRLRVGNYRLLYAIEDDILVIFIVKVAHRRDVYR